MIEAGSLKLENGAKARQRIDTEDRNIPFSNALRVAGIPATDVDYVITNGKDEIRFVLEVTRPDEKVYSPWAYLAAIDARRKSPTKGNHNDTIIGLIAKKLNVPAILVVFEPDMKTVWHRNVEGKNWKAQPANSFFKELKEHALSTENTNPVDARNLFD